MPYCAPDHIDEKAENIGAILEGEREENSLYDLHVGVPKACSVLCAKVREAKGARKHGRSLGGGGMRCLSESRDRCTTH